MHTLYTLAAALACGILWLLGELLGEVIGTLLLGILTLPFLPVHWAIVGVLAGPRKIAWLRGFIALSLLFALGGVMVIATANEVPLPTSGGVMLIGAVLGLVEVERAWKEAKAFLAHRARS